MATVNETVQIAVETETAPVDRLARSVDRLTRQLTRNEKSARRVKASIDRHDASLKKLAQSYRDFTGRMRSAFSITNQFRALLVTLGIKRLIRDAIDARTAMLKMEQAFKVATGSVAAANKEIEFIKETSSELGISFRNAGVAFSRFAIAARTNSKIAAESRDIFFNFAKALRVSGAGAQQTRLAFLALEQMVSKGKVSMEELRRQLGDQLPGAIQIAARAMDMQTSTFIKAVESGNVLAEDLLPAMSKELSKMEDPTENLISSLSKLDNALFDFQNIVGEAIAPAMEEVASKVESWSTENEEMAKRLGEIIGKGLTAFIEVLDFVVKNIDKVVFGLKVWLALKFVSGIGHQAVALSGFSRELKKAVAEIKGVTAASELSSGVIATRFVPAIKGATTAVKGFIASVGGIASIIAVISGFVINKFISGFAKKFQEETEDIVESANEAKDAFDAMRRAVQGIATEADLQIMEDRLRDLGEELVAFTDFVHEFKTGLLEAKGVESVDLLPEGMQNRIKLLEDQLKILQDRFISFNAKTKELGSEFKGLGETGKELSEAVKLTSSSLEEQIETTRSHIQAIKDGEEALREFNMQQFVAAEVAKLGEEATKSEIERIKEMAEELFNLKEELEEVQEQARQGIPFMVLPQARVPDEELPTPPSMRPDIEEIPEEIKDGQEEAANATEDIWKATLENLQKGFADMFEEAMEDGIKSFKDFGKSIIDIFKKIVANKLSKILTQAIERASSQGGGGGGGGGGLGSIFGRGEGGIFSGGSAMGGFMAAGGVLLEDVANNEFSFGTALTAGLAGVGAAFGGPVGAMLGKMVGEYLTDAFGLGASSPSSGFALSMKDGFLGATDIKVNKRSVEGVKERADGVIEIINDVMDAIGGVIESVDEGLRIWEKKGEFQVDLDGEMLASFGDDVEAAVDFFITETLKRADISGISPNVQAALKNTSAETLEQLQSDLEFAMDVDRLGVPELIGSMMDLTRSYESQIQRAEELGIETDNITQSYIDQTRAIRSQITGALDRFIPRTFFDQMSDLAQAFDEAMRNALAFNNELRKQRAARQEEIDQKRAELDALQAQQRIFEQLGGSLGEGGSVPSFGGIGGGPAGVQDNTETINALIEEIAALENLQGAIDFIDPEELRRQRRRAERALKEQRERDIERFQRGVRDLVDPLGAFASTIQGIRDTIARLREEAQRLNQDFEVDEQALIGDAVEAFLDPFRTAMQGPITQEVTALWNQFQEVIATLIEEGLIGRAVQVRDEMDRQLDAIFDNVIEGFREISNPSTDLERELQRLEDQFNDAREAAELTGRSIAELEEEFDAATEATKQRFAEQALSQLDGIIIELLRLTGREEEAAERAFELKLAQFRLDLQVIEATLRLAEALDDTARGLLDEARKLVDDLEEQGPNIGREIGNSAARSINTAIKDENPLLSLFERIFSEPEDLGNVIQQANAEFDNLISEFMRIVNGPFGIGFLRDALEQFGFSIEDIGDPIKFVTDRIEELRRARLEEILNDLMEPIRNFIRGERLGQDSPLRPEEQLGEARSRFEELLAAALSGDVEAIENLPEAADKLLELARSFFASGEGFQEIFNFVQEALEKVTGLTPDDLLNQTEQQTQILGVISELMSTSQEVSTQQLETLSIFSERQHNDMMDLRGEIASLALNGEKSVSVVGAR